ncbi:hypothetical protein Emag_006181 [Eimeria magna]
MEAAPEGCSIDAGRAKQGASPPPPASEGPSLDGHKERLSHALPTAVSASEETAAAAAAGTGAAAAPETVPPATASAVPAAAATAAAAEATAAAAGLTAESAAATFATATTAATSTDESPGALSEVGAPPGSPTGPLDSAAGGPPKIRFPVGANLLAVSLAFLELPCLLRCLLVCNKGLVTLELDAFRLTPKGLGALKGAPLRALALAGIEQKDDAFLQGFRLWGSSRSALSKLGRSLKRLETLAIEIKDERVAVDLAEAAVEASSSTLCRSAAAVAAAAIAVDAVAACLTVGGVSEGCLVNLIRKVGAQLQTFSYTRVCGLWRGFVVLGRLNVGGAPINDSLLYMCSSRMKGLEVLRLSDALTPRAFPWDLHRSLQRPLVSAEGLGRLRPLLGQLKALALNRSCGLPFAVLTDIEVMVFARSLSSNLEELELNGQGLHGISDAFVHEALDACGSGAPARGPHGGSPRKRRRVGGPGYSERLHTWKLKKVSLESSDISDVAATQSVKEDTPRLLLVVL